MYIETFNGSIHKIHGIVIFCHLTLLVFPNKISIETERKQQQQEQENTTFSQLFSNPFDSFIIRQFLYMEEVEYFHLKIKTCSMYFYHNQFTL